MFKHARESEQPQDAFNLKQWQQVPACITQRTRMQHSTYTHTSMVSCSCITVSTFAFVFSHTDFTHFTESFTHSLAHFLAHSLTHSLTVVRWL